MLIAKLKENRNVIAEFKYSERELKKLGLPNSEPKFKKIAVEVIADSVFKNYENVTSVFFVDTLNKTLDGIYEMCK